MISKSSLFASAIALAAIASPCLADGHETKEKGFYGNLGGGLGKLMDIGLSDSLGGGDLEFDQGFHGDIGVGYDWGNNFRTEANYSAGSSDLAQIQNIDVSTIGVDITGWFLSASYDFENKSKWTPYVTLGVGKSEIEVKEAATVGSVSIVVADENITTYLGKLGVSYPVSDKFDVYGEGWLKYYEDFTLGTIDFNDVSAIGATIGGRLHF